MESFYWALGIAAIAFLLGIGFKGIRPASWVVSVLSFVVALAQLLVATTVNIPAPMLTMASSSQEAGMFEVTIKRGKYPFGNIYYRVNQGEPVKYEGGFSVFPQDSVTAYISFLFWSSDCAEDSPRSQAITLHTAITLDGGDAVLRRETAAEDTDLKRIPLYQSNHNDDIEIIDEKGVAQLTISEEDLRELFRSGNVDEVIAAVVVENPDDPQGIVEVTLRGNGRNISIPMQGMVLYLPHHETEPSKAVAQKVWEDKTFSPNVAGLIPCSVADDKIIAIPLTSSAKLQVVSEDAEFADVSPNDKAVNFVGSHGILNGIGGRFSPGADMTRGSIVTALHNMAGTPLVDVEKTAYLDVSKGSWYAQAIAWALDEEIMFGMNGNRFYPDKSVTRGQLALLFWRYSGRPAATSSGLPKYDDLGKVRGDEYIALCWMLQEGILTDAGNDLICPGDDVTREDAAVMLMRLCGWLVGVDVD